MASVPASADAMIGQTLDGRYRIRGVLGRGGMGVVYEAEAIRLGKRPCAIKVLLPEYTRNETVVARFEREAEVAARVKHPNVVEIFDTGTTEGGLGYIAMELLRGETLDRTLRRDAPLPWPRAQKFALQLLRALVAAHARGVIHRDIKPENCIRTTIDDDPDFLKVLDFGIAKLAEPDADEAAARLTATNSVIGTYTYMSCEQICGEPIDHRVDIWAVGIVLYEMLTGRQPFHGTNQGQIWKAITTYEPAPMRDVAPHANIPAAAEPVVARALAKNRDDRWPTADAFARALAAVTLDDHPPPLTAPIPASSPPRAPRTAIDPAALTDPDDLDMRMTVGVNPGGPTELLAEDLRPVTDASPHTAPAIPSTHPGQDAAPPPFREAIQTDVAPRPATVVAAELFPTPAPSLHLRPLLYAFAGLVAAIAILLYAIRDPAAPIEPAPAPAIATFDEPIPTPPAKQLELDDPGPSAINPAPIETPTPPPEPETTLSPGSDSPPETTPKPKPSPTTKKNVPKPPDVNSEPEPEPFAKRVAAIISVWRNSRDVKNCRTQLAEPSLVVTISVSNTGEGTLKPPLLKDNIAAMVCLRRSFERLQFPTARVGEAPFKTIPFTLRSMN